MGLRETVERIAAMPRLPANEEAAKIRVLLPILAELGWDVHDHRDSGEVLWEHPVGPGSGAGQRGRADIALVKTGHGHRLIGNETVAISRSHGCRPARQAQRRSPSSTVYRP